MELIRWATVISLLLILMGQCSLQASARHREESNDVGSPGKRTTPKWFASILDMLDMKQTVEDLLNGVATKASCSACGLVTGLLKSQAVDEERMASIVLGVCKAFKIQSDRVCDGMIKLYKSSFAYILLHTPLSNEELCAVMLGDKCVKRLSDPLNWNVPLPPLPVNLDREFSARSNDQKGTYQVLQLSDLHLDQYYSEGSLAQCNEPLCCRETSGKPTTPDEAAGMWTDYRNCDCSYAFLANVFDHISKNHKVDYVYWTGDTAPHDSWNTTRESIDRENKIVSQLLKKYFNNTRIFINIGNHEGIPVNMFPHPEISGNFSVSLLYKMLVREWTQWMDEESIREFQKFGGYSTVIRPGLRLVSLNTNYCNRLNFWLMLNPVDPGRQLQWLVEELYDAELKGEKVHIIGHIPPGTDDCTRAWLRNYYSIVERFQATIAGQFFGHSHFDEFKVLYDTETHSKPTAVVYLAPSVTPYDHLNPSYRIYTIDKLTNAVIDHTTYYMNLTESNAHRAVKWYEEYSAKKAYNMTSCNAEDWDQLTQLMKIDDVTFRQFYGYYQRFVKTPEEGCDKTCRKKIICRLETRDILDDEDCW